MNSICGKAQYPLQMVGLEGTTHSNAGGCCLNRMEGFTRWVIIKTSISMRNTAQQMTAMKR